MINYSVIIPHHNCPHLLNRLLDSIPQRKDIEIIVVDDCSNENGRPQIDREGVEIIYVTKGDSKGAGRARNIGLKKATGKWLLFADCDDYYINNAFDEFDKVKDSDYDIIFFDYDNNQNKDTRFQYRLNKMLEGGKRDRANFKHMSNTPWHKMYRREFVNVNNIHFEEIPIQNDSFFVHTASSLTDNFYYIDEKLYYYEINNSGITRLKRKKEDFERSTTTRIKVDRLKAESGAWDYIYLSYGRKISEYGCFFVVKQQLRRVKHGLLYYLIRKHL